MSSELNLDGLKEFSKPDELAKFLGVGASAIVEEIKAKRLGSIHACFEILIPKTSVRLWLDSCWVRGSME